MAHPVKQGVLMIDPVLMKSSLGQRWDNPRRERLRIQKWRKLWHSDIERN